MADTITPAEFLRELQAATADDRARLEAQKLTLEFSQPIVRGYRRKRRRQARGPLPLIDIDPQEEMFR